MEEDGIGAKLREIEGFTYEIKLFLVALFYYFFFLLILLFLSFSDE